MVFCKLSVPPLFSMPPPLSALLSALLLDTVELVKDRLPPDSLSMAPPNAAALLSKKVLLLAVTVPPLFSMAPPDPVL